MNNPSQTLSMLLGFDAYSLDNESTDVRIINKSLENGTQYINSDISLMSDINSSLLNTLNMIDSTIKNDPFDASLNSDNTYTIDDLLGLENEELTTSTLFNEAFDNDTPFLPSGNAVLETAVASPLSSSSDESCDLNDLLFLSEASFENAMETELPENFPHPEQSEPFEESNAAEASQNDSQVTSDTIDQSTFLEALKTNGTDLSALCSLLFQNQSPASPSESLVEESLTFSEPSSPSSSESECESVRYKPYKKPKTTEQKQRKKAQNRTAATRYRIKKKDELKAMVEEADELEKKNKDLKGKVDGLKTEIGYLKNLMLDVIKARLAKGATTEKLLSVVMAQ